MSKNRKHDCFLDYQVEIQTAEIRLKRNRWGLLYFLLFISSFLSLFYFVFFWILIDYILIPKDFLSPLWLLLFFIGAFLSIMTYVICSAFPSYATSRVQFFPDSRKTIITYFGIFQRSIPDFPSKLVIRYYSTGSSKRGVSANLLYAHQRHRIQLFLTQGIDVDNSKEALALGMQETEEIRSLLKLEIQFID